MTVSKIAKGAHWETIAAKELVRRGYKILRRNFRCRVGELDIVAQDRSILVFVEVRGRTEARWGSAEETVTHRKQRQIAQVARYYLAQNTIAYDSCRFDVVGITGNQIQIIQDAFRVGLEN